MSHMIHVQPGQSFAAAHREHEMKMLRMSFVPEVIISTIVLFTLWGIYYTAAMDDKAVLGLSPLTWLIVALGVTVVGVPLMAYLIHSRFYLLRNGVEVTAEITKCDCHVSDGRQSLAFSFTYNDHAYSVCHDSDGEHDDMKLGDSVTLLVDPKKPKHMMVLDYRP